MNLPVVARSTAGYSTIPGVLQLGDKRLRRKSHAIANVTDILHDATLHRESSVVHQKLHQFRSEVGFGRAISAPQCNYHRRLIAIDLSGPDLLIFTCSTDLTVAFSDTFTMWDDCMSFPHIMVKVRRNVSISVSFLTTNRALVEIHWHRLPQNVSELLQHEIDHLDGVLAVDRAIHKDGDESGIIDRKQWLKFQDKYAMQCAAADNVAAGDDSDENKGAASIGSLHDWLAEEGSHADSSADADSTTSMSDSVFEGLSLYYPQSPTPSKTRGGEGGNITSRSKGSESEDEAAGSTVPLFPSLFSAPSEKQAPYLLLNPSCMHEDRTVESNYGSLLLKCVQAGMYATLCAIFDIASSRSGGGASIAPVEWIQVSDKAKLDAFFAMLFHEAGSRGHTAVCLLLIDHLSLHVYPQNFAALISCSSGSGSSSGVGKKHSPENGRGGRYIGSCMLVDRPWDYPSHVLQELFAREKYVDLLSCAQGPDCAAATVAAIEIASAAKSARKARNFNGDEASFLHSTSHLGAVTHTDTDGEEKSKRKHVVLSVGGKTMRITGWTVPAPK
eukprot:GSChrysophyteH2.ASY1.ANO1.582.1 assembled CDS